MSTAPNGTTPSTAIPAVQPPTGFWARFGEPWLLWHIPAFLYWWALAASIINTITGEEIILSHWSLFALPAICYAIVLKRNKGGILGGVALTIMVFFYYGLFPLVGPLLIVLQLPNMWVPAKRALYYAMWLLHIGFGLFYFVLLLYAWCVLLYSHRPNVITAAVCIDVILNIAILLVAMRWAADPTYPFLQIAALWLWFEERQNRVSGIYANEQAKMDEAKKAAGLLAQFETIFESFVGFVKWLEERSIVVVFTCVLMSLFALTVFGYGLCMYALQRVQCQPDCYTGLDSDLYGTCIYSLSVLATAPLTNVIPCSPMAKFLYGIELVNTFLIATVFFGMFSAAKGLHGEERYNEFMATVEKIRKSFANAKQRLAAILNPLPQPSLPAPPSEKTPSPPTEPPVEPPSAPTS